MLFLTSCTEINNASKDKDAPATPKNFILIGGGDGQAYLKWETNSEPDFNEYRLYRSKNDLNSFLPIISLKQSEYVDRFLEYESTYYYYITAVDFAGNESEKSNVYNIQPLNISAPQPPYNIQITPLNNPSTGTVEISISWIPPEISDLKEFAIYRDYNEDFIASEDNFISKTTIASYTDKDVVLNQKYYYSIIAIDNGDKESVPSDTVSDLILSNPKLIIPANYTNFSKPYIFRWEGVSDAVNYSIFIGTAPLSNIIWSQQRVDSVETVYNGDDLESGKLYYWWVGAYSKESPSTINSYSVINSFFAK